MGEKKLYRKPALQAYGDIRELTAGLNKELGQADSWIILKDENGGPPPPAT